MKTILIIEDDENIRENLEDILMLNSFNVIKASNGREGIVEAKKSAPDLIICDIMMPSMDGYEVKTALENDKILSRIPFIFLTAKAEIGEIRKGMILGADDYIVKPFNNRDLIDSINSRFDRLAKLSNENTEYRSFEKQIDDRIMIKSEGKEFIIVIADIIYIESDGNYCLLGFSNNTIIKLKKTLKEWEQILPSKYFIRIHQSNIVNLKYLDKIEKLTNRSFFLKLKKTEKLFIVSQRYSQKLKELLKA